MIRRGQFVHDQQWRRLMRRIPRFFSASAVLLITALPAVAAECVFPGPAPVMPQGATSSKNEMSAGKLRHDQYIAALQSFKSCQAKQIATAPKSTKPQVLKSWRDSVEAADDAITAVDLLYQSQMWAYENRKR
jgi:hypothetical protein